MTTTLSEREQVAGQAAWHADWLVAFGPDVCRLAASSSLRTTRRWHSSASELSVAGVDGSDLRVAEGTKLVVLFSGLLTNVQELSAWRDPGRRGRHRPAAGAEARCRCVQQVARTVRRPGLGSARGNPARGARPGGTRTGFYARSGAGWLLSPSPDILARQPGVSSEPDAVALSEWVCGWFPAVEDTTYRAVKRVPPGSAITYQGNDARVHRYWDPFPEGRPIDWLKESDLEEFESHSSRRSIARRAGSRRRFFSAVASTRSRWRSRRRISAGNGISVAAGALAGVSRSRIHRRTDPDRSGVAPWARPGARAVQRHRRSTRPAAGRAALSAASPQPVWNMWAPAYKPMARSQPSADGGSS